MDAIELADRVLSADPRAIARAISVVEDEDAAAGTLISAIFGQTGRAQIIGITGPPGAGKSTLVDRLTLHYRDLGRTVGVIAVDPTSPFTGGAVLGDRVRMQQHAGDPGVFVRSMATRGHLGGLARATADAALILDAAGRDVVIIETVGVGQDEVDIIRTADVSVVTLVPGTGDDVQALKAGIMEIADIFVVNKSDRDGADHLVSAIESNLSLHTYGADQWRPPILKTIATSGEGVATLVATIEAFRAHGVGPQARHQSEIQSGQPSERQSERRRSHCESRLRELVAHRFMAHLERRVLAPGELASIVDRIADRHLDPYTAATQLLQRSIVGAPLR